MHNVSLSGKQELLKSVKSKGPIIQGVITGRGVIAVYNMLNDAVFITVPEKSSYYYLNDAVENIYGYTKSEFYDGGCEFWRSCIHPEDLTDIIQNKEEAKKFRIITPDNKIKWIESKSRIKKNSTRANYQIYINRELTTDK